MTDEQDFAQVYVPLEASVYLAFELPPGVAVTSAMLQRLSHEVNEFLWRNDIELWVDDEIISHARLSMVVSGIDRHMGTMDIDGQTLPLPEGA